MTGIPPSSRLPGPLGGFSDLATRLTDITIAINKLIVTFGEVIPTFTSGLVIPQRIVTVAGAVTMAASDYLIIINKTVPAATTVNLIGSPPTGRIVGIKDGGGNASSNPITIVPNAGTIDGAATAIISADYQCSWFEYNGVEWGGVKRF